MPMTQMTQARMDDTRAGERLEAARAVLARAEEDARASSARGQDASSGSDTRVTPGRRGGRSSRGRSSGGGRAERRARDAEAPPLEAERDAEADTEAVARAIVLRQLTMGPRSRAQLEDKLRAKGCPDDAAVAVLDRFTELGLIDDHAYAQMLVNSQHQSRGLARRALARELRRKGVGEEHAEDALAQVDSADEEARARELVRKKLRTMHGLEAVVQTRRLAGMLARKGYSSSMSYRVIREELDQAPEHRRD